MVQRFPLIVELLGPSGSGKTTILNAAQASLIDNGWIIPDNVAERQHPLSSVLYEKNVLDDQAKREFVRLCLEIAGRNDWLPSQALSAINILRASCHADALHRAQPGEVHLVHDELLLHRAFSFLPRSASWEADAVRYFQSVPLPTAAVVVSAEADENLRRLAGRGHNNVTRGLSERGLSEVVDRSQAIAARSAQLLRERGLPVLEIDSRKPLEASVSQLMAFVEDVRRNLGELPPAEFLRRKIIEVCQSFHTRGRRHTMRTQGVAYGSFEVGRVSLSVADSQRDTRKRLLQFGITRADVEGRKVLDLGCNTGAVLFELCNWGIASGYGVEIDADKVNVAMQVRNYLELNHLTFECGDIDSLPPGVLPKFDVTFALAVEGHVIDKAGFYRLLAEVTKDRIYFEANGGADIAQVSSMLAREGFAQIEDRGVCSDDRDPRNHSRRLLVARRRVASNSQPGVGARG